MHVLLQIHLAFVSYDLYTMQPAAARLPIKSVVCGATHGAERPSLVACSKSARSTVR